MIKVDELTHPMSCLSRAEDDEPLFVLRANDETAPAIVETWARNYIISKSPTPTDAQFAKYNEAKDIARAMREWKAKENANTPQAKLL